eukprot:TRINITY_DN9238_c0_g1_i1.p1 TRINITY_DN9238_c0_g1~~TRINITY_DN9238_c0_g1_i1.p1  ORF type:complete len:329 (-),score=50.29 TRINITY_DN9238_c0_g1_i1:336-1322(-)
MADVMKAVCYRGFKGGVSGLENTELPIPTPRKGEVLVKVEAVSVNPVDWKIQSGYLRPFCPAKFPHVPGLDIAGEIIQTGPGVKSFTVGQKVVTVLELKHGGGFAEYVSTKTTCLATRPSEVSAEIGAALPIAGMTALQCLRDVAGVSMDGSYKGNILITAASGGVGVYAVQLAKLGGAHVTATCGARNVELVKSLGADEVLDYKTPEGSKLTSPSGKKYNSVVHCASNIPWSTFEAVLADGGRVINITPGPAVFALCVKQKLTFAKKRVVPYFTTGTGADLQLLVDLSAEGKLKTIIDSQYPLVEAAKAWEKSIEGHVTGKVVVKME